MLCSNADCWLCSCCSWRCFESLYSLHPLEGNACTAAPVLLQVYCPDTGALLERRDWLLRDESKLAQHSTFGLPCWDSR